MAEALKVLAQLEGSTTLSALYTVPAATQATVSSFVVCNRTSATRTFRMSIAVAGAADDAKQYLYFDVTLTKNNTFAATLGITLGATDVVRVQASANTSLSFSLFGVEVS
jgi:hypothetical protein